MKDPAAPRNGMPWKISEIYLLIELYSRGVRWGLIAHELGRTVPACVMRLRAVRYYYKMPKKLWNRKSSTLTDNKMEIKKRMS